MSMKFPVKSIISEIRLSRIWDSVGDTDEDACWGQNPVNLIEGLLTVGPTAISAKNGVESTLVDNSVEGALVKLEAPDVHLLVTHIWAFSLIFFSHCLYYSE